MTKEPCPHLEKLLPSMGAGTRAEGKVLRYGQMEKVESQIVGALVNSSSWEIGEFIHKLRGFGLPEHQIAILIDRFVDSKTFAEITKERHFVSLKVTYAQYRDALETVRRKLARGNQ